MTGKFYSTRQVANALGVSPASVRSWVDRGLLRACRVGDAGRLRIHESALAAAVKARLARPESAAK